MDQLHLVAQYLIRKEKVDGKVFLQLMKGEITMADIQAMDEEGTPPAAKLPTEGVSDAPLEINADKSSEYPEV